MSNSSAIPIPGTCYIVGGAVRDSLLGIDSKDRDWVVVGATPEQMIDAGFKQVGADFPVFLHPTTNEEYALARTERKQGHGYHGFVCDFGPDISLEEDLERRDLRINAMAMSSDGELIDPFGGKEDLSKKVLRHVSDAFSEDPLRVLRVARFAARFHDLGFHVDADTMGLMSDLVKSHELSKLTAERVWQETSRALSEKAPWVYFELLRESGALAVIMPELDVLFGVPQPEKHHPEIDCGVHALLSLRSATVLSESVSVRFAALIHDLGKGLTPEAVWPKHHGHEKSGLKPIKQLCKRLKTPRRDQTLALLACEFHTHIHRAYELRPETVLKVLKACDALRKPDLFQDVLLVCQADAQGRTGFENQAYPQADYFAQALRLVRSFNIKPLLDSGLEGKELGAEIDRQRTLILGEHRTLHQKRPS